MAKITESDVIQRVETFRKSTGYSVDEFSTQLELNAATYRNMISVANAKPISKQTILNLLSHYPEISADWLLKGRGAMHTRIEIADPAGDYGSSLTKGDYSTETILSMMRELMGMLGRVDKKIHQVFK